MKHPLISVIIPVHNTEKYLAQCLDTIFIQTIQDFEIICVNDGSTDSSADILNRYQKIDPRLQVYQTDNVGVSQARNIALDNATGEYIVFIDSDDFVDPQLFAKTIAHAEKTKSDIVIFDYFLYSQPSGALDTYRDQELYRKLNGEIFSLATRPAMIQFMGIWDRIFRRSFIEEHQFRFLPDHIYEDAIFSVEAMLKCQRVSLLAEHLYYYRRGVSGSITFDEGKNNFKKQEFIFAQRRIQNLLKKSAASPKVRYFYLHYFIEYSLMHQRFSSSKQDFNNYFNTIRAMIFPNFSDVLPANLVLKRAVYLRLLAANQRNICRLLINLANFPRIMRNKITTFVNTGLRKQPR
ncbi:glycosyltransferase family 2 protein [Arcanobacterium hippocoleae]|uniref:glycosyltransferase family 2 protein n=1 Tax=Arcanobacterium hippocoleae TaxID=149017 RepID=UPI003340B8EE